MQQREFYIEAKERVSRILDAFKVLVKSNKDLTYSDIGEKAIKIMEAFLRCNLTDPIIEQRYNAVREILQKYGRKAPDIEGTIDTSTTTI